MALKAVSGSVARWLALVGVVGVAATGCASSGSRGVPSSAASTTPATKVTTHHRHATRRYKPAFHRQRHRRNHHAAVRVTVRGVPAADVPNPALTPGAALTTSAAQVCEPGYAAGVRDVSEAEKDAVYARYGVAHVAYQHEVDHLFSLEVGGSNAITNLWPEPYAGRWGARTKDVLENKLHDLVCSGRLSLPFAQHIEARNWVAAYKRYVGDTPSAPNRSGATGGDGGGSGGGGSAGGYYASSYPSASTIYCADDSEWRSLSKTYLVHFQTWAQAIRHFSSYHLHQPC